MKLWMNGVLRDATRPWLMASDRGVTLGDGLYETIRVRSGVPVHLPAHLERLARGAGLLGLSLPYDAQALANACGVLLLDSGTPADAVLRLTVTRGPGPRGLLPPATPAPVVMLTIGAWTQPPPVTAIVATVTRRNEFSPLAQVKSTNCLDAILARNQAASRGADEAILLNTAGRVAEATIANLFAVIGGTLVTPPVEEGCLAGVGRGIVLAQAKVTVRPVTVAELVTAQEIFLTSSLGIRPVTSLEGRGLAAGTVAATLSL